jgi:hypothetical protein
VSWCFRGDEDVLGGGDGLGVVVRQLAARRPQVQRSAVGYPAAATRNWLGFLLAAVGVAAATPCLVGPVSAAEPKMRIDPRLQSATACFPVTDPLGLPRTL